MGLGGAAFPTYRKLELPPGAAGVDTFILNGAECEPYLTSDTGPCSSARASRRGRAGDGAAARRAAGCCSGIEADKMPAAMALEAAAREALRDTARDGAAPTFDVPCEVRYPQGAERSSSSR